jgi:hypothetical protein
MNSQSESLHAFKDSISTVMRLMMLAFRNEFEQVPDQFDAYLNQTFNMLEAKDAAKASVVSMSTQLGDTLTQALLAKPESPPDFFEPTPSSPRRMAPSLVIYPEEETQHQTVVVEKMPSEAKIVQVIEPVNTIHPVNIDEDIEEENVEDISETPSIASQDSEAEEDDQEETMKISIGRGKNKKDYLLGKLSNNLYDIEGDGTPGAVLGTYENKKLVPL